MYKVLKLLFIIMFSSSTSLAFSQTSAASKTGPKSQNVTPTELIFKLNAKSNDPNVAQLTASQSAALLRVTFYQDRQYPNVYFYTPSLILAKGGTDAYSDNVNFPAYDAMRSMNAMIQGALNPDYPLADQAMRALFGIERNANSVEGARASNRVTTDNSPPNVAMIEESYRSILNDKNFDLQNRFIQAVRFAAASVGWPIAGKIDNRDKALKVYAAMVAGAPVASLTVPVAFGFDRETMEAFATLRKGLPELTFYQMSMDPIWKVRPSPYVSDRPSENRDSDSDSYLASLKIDNGLIIGIQDLPISSAGGNMELLLTYAGALRFGYGVTDGQSTDALLNDVRQNLQYILPGTLFQERGLNFAFQGVAKCRFKGAILLDRKVDMTKISGVVAAINIGVNIDKGGPAPEINECEIYDTDGVQASKDDPTIATMVEVYKREHIEKNLSTYNAALSAKKAVLEQALVNENLWKTLPMPQEWKLKKAAEKVKTCVATQRNGTCINHSHGGWGKKVHCEEYQVVAGESCSEVWKWMDTYAYEPATFAYFKNDSEYKAIFDREDTFPINISLNDAKFVLQSTNQVCLSRKKRFSSSSVGFERSNCSIKEANGALLDKTVDISALPNDPVIMIPAGAGI